MASMTQVREMTEFARVMNEEFGAAIRPDSLEELIRLAGRLQRINEADCNGPEDLSGRRAKREERLQIRVRAVVEAWGGNVRFNGDPRSYAVWILLPHGGLPNSADRRVGIGVP